MATTTTPPRRERTLVPPRQGGRGPGRSLPLAGRRGDAVVQQVKSGIGADERQLRALRSLGLGRIGRAVRFSSSSAPALGAIRRVRHLVAVTSLTVAGHRSLRLAEEERQMLTNKVPYDVAGRRAFRFEVDPRSFLAVEPYEDFVTVTWSTGLDIADVLALACARLPDPSGTAVLYEPAQEDHRELPSVDALQSLRTGRSQVPFARLQFGDTTLVWHRPRLPKHVDDGIEPGRIGLILRTFEVPLVTELVRDTGTTALGREAEAIVRDASEQLERPPSP